MILRVSWIQNKTNERVLETTGIERGLLNMIKRMKLSYFGHVMRKEGDCLEKKSCKTLHREQKKKGDQGCDGWTTWKNGPRIVVRRPIEEDERQTRME